MINRVFLDLMTGIFRAFGYDDDRASEAATWLMVLCHLTALYLVVELFALQEMGNG